MFRHYTLTQNIESNAISIPSYKIETVDLGWMKIMPYSGKQLTYQVPLHSHIVQVNFRKANRNLHSEDMCNQYRMPKIHKVACARKLQETYAHPKLL